MGKKKILIVCTGNTCRSPLAEAMVADHLAKSMLGNACEVSSGGISALDNEPATAHAIQVARELGLNLAKHAARKINGHTLMGSDLILCMTKAHKFYLLHNFKNLLGKCFTLAECASAHDIPDPFGEDLGAYRKMAMDIKNLLPSLVNFLEKFFS
jgi:protein-tyrosine phosphatase